MRTGKPAFTYVLKKVIPWVVTLLLVAYLGYTTDLETAWDALAEVNLLALFAVALVGTMATYLTDTISVSQVFNRFVCPISYRETLPIKATSYILNVLNYNVALVGMAFYLQRSKGAPFWRALGSLFFLNFVDILGLSILLTIGLLMTGSTDAISPPLQLVAWTLVAGGVGGFSFLVLVCRMNWKIPLIGRLFKLELLAPLAEVDLPTLVRFLAVRICLLLQYLVSQYLFLRIFGIEIPISRMLVYVPLLTFVQIIPITISGLGTVQVVMRHFYSRYVIAAIRKPAAIIDAFSIASLLSFLVLRVIVAYMFLGEFSREVIKTAKDSVDQSDSGNPEPASE